MVKKARVARKTAKRVTMKKTSGGPDFANLLKVLRHQVPARPTLFEFFLNGTLYAKLSGRPYKKAEDRITDLRRLVLAFKAAGYDYATFHGSGFGFPAGEKHRAKTISLNEGAVISDRKSLDAYAWSDPEEYDYSALENIAPDLPDGMKIVVCGPGGVLENAISLVGYDQLCFMLADDPDLGRDLFDAIGSRLVKHYRIAAAFKTVGACISNDDWGFKTQPMLSPAQLRQYVFPWHKKIVETIHAAGKPAILHSCGNAAAIMDDIIDGMKYDGKHSYEDVIQPVEEAYEQYGKRIAILGGIDLDFVCRSTPEQVKKRSLAMLERAAARGSYALGTGNSVPEYVPQQNYFAMTSAATEGRG
jgi:uroporphyrinogen decarboxylase